MFGGRSGRPSGGAFSLSRLRVACTLEMWSFSEFLSKPKSWKSNRPSAYPPRRSTVRERRSRSSGLMPSVLYDCAGKGPKEMSSEAHMKGDPLVLRYDYYCCGHPVRV